ncbi:MAG: glutamine synthetase family protein [Treponema sp.]|nr:glutamine synthetase family protein [Treponema sp.]
MEYTKREVLQYIEENNVKFIKLFFVDIFGDVKSISIQPPLLNRAFEEGISFDASAVKGFLNEETSDLFIVPDPSTLSVLPWRPQHGRVARLYCNIRYLDGTPFAGDSRLILQNVIDRCKKMGYETKIGTECEFYLFKLDENGMPTAIPHDNASYCDLAPLDKGENVRRDIILTLEQMGIQPETSHHENGPGQNEIDFRYNDIMNAADNLSTFKMAVRTIAAQDGLFASFMPKPVENKSGSGLHVNISLHKDGENIFGKDSPDSKYFIAGILSHIREITAFLNPLNQSYKRLGEFEAPKYVSWSSQNRSPLIRVPAAKGDAVRIEVRSPDSSCNQYLALALLIAAGLDGIEKKMELMPAENKNLLDMPESELKHLERLPSSLKEALSLAEKSPFVQSVIPDLTLRTFVQTKSKCEDPAFGVI